MSMPWGSLSIKTAGLSSSFQYEENKSMVAEKMEEYALDSSGVAYETPGEQAPMGFISSGGEIQVSENTPPWVDWKCSYFPSLTGTKNTKWDTAAVHMSISE